MPNSKTSKASYVSKTRRVTLEKYKILNRDSRKKLKTEKLKKKLKTQEKTQNSSQKLKNSAFFRPLHAEKMAKKPAWVTYHMHANPGGCMLPRNRCPQEKFACHSLGNCLLHFQTQWIKWLRIRSGTSSFLLKCPWETIDKMQICQHYLNVIYLSNWLHCGR